MPKKTLYVRDVDLPIWEAAEKILGEKSMSMLVTEALREKLARPRDGFLHVLNSNPGTPLANGQVAVMFAPLDQDGAMKPHYCTGLEDLKTFLGKLGLTARAITQIVEDLAAQNSSSVRIAMTQETIDLI